jgi:hypothetical protein
LEHFYLESDLLWRQFHIEQISFDRRAFMARRATLSIMAFAIMALG